ncbi:MAG TPA: IS66 family transposase [Saprospiraceae bacterium]|nr:IS66 family transposase [Saprospiraceae bacterium]
MTKLELIAENERLKAHIAKQNLILAKLQKMLFGPKSERYKKEEEASNQMRLFGTQISKEEQQQAQEQEKETITYQRKKTKEKKSATRIPLPEDLPRIEVVIEPSGDLSGLVKIGEEVTEILDIIPPQFQVIRIVRPKYAKPEAKTQQIANPILIAPMPERVIDKGIPSTRLLVYIIMSKFVDHLPYYRQIEMFKRIGLKLKSNTINGWIAKTCVLLKPLYEAFCKHQFSKKYLQADESTIKVLKVKKNGKKGKAHTGYYWVYYDPIDHHVVFVYDPGRGRKYPVQHLKDFKGSLQTDGLSVYDEFDKLDHITLIACMAHIRRKFIEALPNDKKGAEPAIVLIQQLYEIEQQARQNNYSAEQRLDLRQQKAVPIMEQLKNYLDKLHDDPQVLNSSALGGAVRYALGRWKYQKRYLEDGQIEIDNNLVENAIRPIALGRKNYLFAGSENGAQWGAMIYTLLGSAIRQGHKPMEYLCDILRRLPNIKISELNQLFPANWKKQPDNRLDLI